MECNCKFVNRADIVHFIMVDHFENFIHGCANCFTCGWDFARHWENSHIDKYFTTIDLDRQQQQKLQDSNSCTKSHNIKI